MEPDWIDHKINSARFIQSRLEGMKRVLSIGCGIGIIEKYLFESGVKRLEIHEVSEEPLHWIRPHFANEAIHIGVLPKCLSSLGKYDYIFLSAIDYGFKEQEWAELLMAIKKILNPTGRCLVVSSTFYLSDFYWSELKFWVKFKLKFILSLFGFYDLGQLVGWRRNLRGFQSAMVTAGFNIIEEGFLGQDAILSKTYWIEGRLA